jgi:uncharacterized membrane protein
VRLDFLKQDATMRNMWRLLKRIGKKLDVSHVWFVPALAEQTRSMDNYIMSVYHHDLAYLFEQW